MGRAARAGSLHASRRQANGSSTTGTRVPTVPACGYRSVAPAPLERSGLTLKQARSKADELAALVLHRVATYANTLPTDWPMNKEQPTPRGGRPLPRLRKQRSWPPSAAVTVRRLFELWQRAELTPQTLADGTRTRRKDAGKWVMDSFERRLLPEARRGDRRGRAQRRSTANTVRCKAGRAASYGQCSLGRSSSDVPVRRGERDRARNPLEGIHETTSAARMFRAPMC